MGVHQLPKHAHLQDSGTFTSHTAKYDAYVPAASTLSHLPHLKIPAPRSSTPWLLQACPANSGQPAPWISPPDLRRGDIFRHSSHIRAAWPA